VWFLLKNRNRGTGRASRPVIVDRGRNALGVTNEKKKAVEPLQEWFGENGVSPETPELAFCGEG